MMIRAGWMASRSVAQRFALGGQAGNDDVGANVGVIVEQGVLAEAAQGGE